MALAMLLVSVPAAAVAIQQAWTARSSAHEASEQASIARDLAKAAREQAEAAKAQAKYAERLAELSDKSLEVARAERDAALRVATATEHSAQSSRDQIAAMTQAATAQITAAERRDQEARRARLSAGDIFVELAVGKRPKAKLEVENRGSTSAYDVYVWNDWVRADAQGNLPATPACASQAKNASLTIGSKGGWTLSRAAAWTAAESSALGEKTPLTIIGSICYADEQGRQHQTTFCREVPGDGTVTKCPRGETER